MKPIFSSLVILLFSLPLMAKPTLVKTSSTDVCVEFFTPRTVHITKVPTGRTISHPSLVVTAQPQDIDVKRGESGSEVSLSSSELTVRVNKTTGRISFEGRKVKNLLQELSYGFEERTGGPDKGAYRVTTAFALQKDEPIYGLGTLQDGKISHRGKRVEMEQSNLQDFQPVFQSIRGWSIYWDNYSRTIFDATGQNKMELSSEVGDGVDYYFMLGGSVDGNIAEMATARARYLSTASYKTGNTGVPTIHGMLWNLSMRISSTAKG